MNNTNPSRLPKPLSGWTLAACAIVYAALNTFSWAGPGAHGPNGEHLDVPTLPHAASTVPRLEAHSEVFELVAELRAGELTILVDRYETNEPVLGAKLEVESGGSKAMATFRPEQGDYAVTDRTLLNALAGPGEHGLIFTLVSSSESDLLDGTLVTPQGVGTSNSGPGDNRLDLVRLMWLGGGVAALGLLGGAVWRRQRRHRFRPSEGGL